MTRGRTRRYGARLVQLGPNGRMCADASEARLRRHGGAPQRLAGRLGTRGGEGVGPDPGRHVVTVLFWGLPGDSTIKAVRRATAALGLPEVFLDQRRVLETRGGTDGRGDDRRPGASGRNGSGPRRGECCIPARISREAGDYRYAALQGLPRARLDAVDLPDETTQQARRARTSRADVDSQAGLTTAVEVAVLAGAGRLGQRPSSALWGR